MINQEDIKIGAVVRHLGNSVQWGNVYAEYFGLFTITEEYDNKGGYFTEGGVHISAVRFNKELFELADSLFMVEELQSIAVDVVPTNIADFAGGNIARPILAERKVGKVRMELVDDGFANAVFEIAKVMSWASLNKGYKDGDWKSLPDMEKAFKGAASRHRTKHDIQRISDTAPLSCVDEESGLLHKAHEAFNVLAQLEMILTGRIK